MECNGQSEERPKNRAGRRRSAACGAIGDGAEADDDELRFGGLAFAEFDTLQNGPRGVGHLGLLVGRGSAGCRFSVHAGIN